MDRYRRLRKEAMKACEFRGHKMGKWSRQRFNQQLDNQQMWRSRIIEEARCLVCDKWVQIDTLPAPNGIDIGGTAVALNCEEVA